MNAAMLRLCSALAAAGFAAAVLANPLRADAPPAGESLGTAASDWRQDAPGRLHRVTADSLPAPYATASAQNPPRIVARPAGAELALPPGFRIALFAEHFSGPRKMLAATNGDVIVSETFGGRIIVLRPSADGRVAASRETFARGLKTPFGLAFYPDAAHPRWLYVAETNRVLRYPYTTGDLTAHGRPEIVIDRLPMGGGHFTRDIAFAPDGSRMFVSVGSSTNVADGMSKKTAAEVARWEAQHGLGAAWDAETDRAAVFVYAVDSPLPGRLFASGIRNCVSLTVQPVTADLWCTTNERDGLGDELVPDYSTRVRQSAFYGWPWYYTGPHEDPRLRGDRPDLRDKVAVPDVLYQAHSAALGLTFYTASSGASAFPPEYVGDGFVTLHGSWNRQHRTGHKVVRLRMRGGQPTGEYEDFLTGFVIDDGTAWGRPVATVELADGSLLMSDDGADVIYRISYAPGAAP